MRCRGRVRCSCSARTSASTAAPSASPGLLEQFGAERIRDTPISELGIVGAAVGAAMCGHASDRRDPVLRLHQPGDGPDRQPGRQDPLHARRRGQRADGAARTGGLRHRRGGAALAVLGGVVRACPRTQGGPAGHCRRRQGPAAVGDRRSEPGHRDRAQAALPHQRPRPGRKHLGSRWAKRPSADQGDDLTIVATGIMVSKSVEAAKTLAAEASVSPSSTRAPSCRSTRTPSWTQSRAPAGSCSSRRRRSPADSM